MEMQVIQTTAAAKRSRPRPKNYIFKIRPARPGKRTNITPIPEFKTDLQNGNAQTDSRITPGE